MTFATGESVLPIGSAGATTTDNGWTQGYNNGYPAGSPSPNCYPSCWIWVPGINVTYAEATNVPFYDSELGYAVNRWNNVRWNSNDIYLILNEYYGTNAAVYGYMQNNNDPNNCAITSTSVNYASPDGGRNQLQIVQAQIAYNNQQTFGIGSYHPGWCDMGVTATHELGHTVGLGHTNNSYELMYPYQFNGSSYTPQSRDACGFNVIYYQSTSC